MGTPNSMPTRPVRYQQPGVAPRDEAERRYDVRRGSAAARGYGRDWQALRLAVLQAEPLCRFCSGRGLVVAASEVDHIVPVERAPELRLVESNLRPLCKPCHSARTARDTAAVLRSAE